jgi:hypothetical protein
LCFEFRFGFRASNFGFQLMSDREFDNYLTLLAGLLRLDGKQRGAIAEELRSHLEDRLEELVARGVARDEAIQQALAEFGDAAGLAGQFVAISRNRKRRWLMRAMTFSVAAMSLFAAGLAIFWPGRNAAPGVANLVGQDVQADNKKSTPPDQAQNEPTLEEKLNKRLDVDFVDTPLKDAISFLQDNTGIQFVIRQKKLEEAGNVSVDTPINKTLKRVRVSTLLELLLDELELTYVDRDDLLLITTPEDAEATLQIRVYDCRDLLALRTLGKGGTTTATTPVTPQPNTVVMGATGRWVPAPPNNGPPPGVPSLAVPAAGVGSASSQFTPVPTPGTGGIGGTGGGMSRSSGGSAGGRGMGGGGVIPRPASAEEQRVDDLIDLVTSIVAPDSWDDVGGPGAISVYDGLVVVAQTARVHKSVERLFDMLREAAGLEVPMPGRVVR